MADVIAEKYRALLQQVIRRRERRQDVYDIDFLVNSSSFDGNGMETILRAVLEKCRARGIEPEIDSFDDPDVKKMAQARWDSIELELGVLPDFDLCFESVRRFYRALPWGSRS